ncbi:MAG: barstar family protein [Terracidiphilus sp.]
MLAADLKWLQSNGYGIIEFDAGVWKSEEQMHIELKSGLSFPDYYGKNLDSLNDSMREDLAIPDEGGLVLVLRRYDHFAKAAQIGTADLRTFAEMVLDNFARAVRYHILFGRRLIIILQSDDPRVRFENLAPVAADWNPREWLPRIEDSERLIGSNPGRAKTYQRDESATNRSEWVIIPGRKPMKSTLASAPGDVFQNLDARPPTSRTLFSTA